MKTQSFFSPPCGINAIRCVRKIWQMRILRFVLVAGLLFCPMPGARGASLLEYTVLLAEIVYDGPVENLALTFQDTEGNLISFTNQVTDTFLEIPATLQIGTNDVPITGIADNALLGASNITTLVISANMTNANAFSFLSEGLTNITVEAANPVYSSVDGVLFNKDVTELVYYPPGKAGLHFDIPDSVTGIGPNAFYSELTLGLYEPYIPPAELTSISVPDSVTRIDQYAFATLRNLTSISLPDSVTNIGNGAFAELQNLTSIILPDSVTHIGNSAFARCDSLENIKLPVGLARIPNYMFEGCFSLTDIEIPNGVTHIGEGAFSICGFSQITIPDGVVEIEQSAFNYCTNLVRVTIPGSVTNLGYYVFRLCDNLEAAYFAGTPPSISAQGLTFAPPSVMTVYYPQGVSGWGATYSGKPTSALTTVSSSADSGAGSLRQAIADVPPSGTIAFSPALSGSTIALTTGELLLNKDLTIDASLFGADHVAIDGGGASRIFEIPSGEFNMTLSGLTLTNGYAVGSGGAVLVNNGASLTIQNAAVVGNTASGGGGGIQSTGSLTMENCMVADNSAIWAAGIWSTGSGSSMSLDSCTVSRNTGASGSGGIVFETGSGVLNNTVVAGNIRIDSADDTDIGGGGGTLSLTGNNFIGIQAGSYASVMPAGAPNGNGDYVGTTASPLDPQLAPVGDYGGPTPTMSPLPGSVVINAGGTTTLATDQRGRSRIAQGSVDIGAVEYRGSFDPLWHTDLDHDGYPFAVEFALGTDTSTSDTSNPDHFAVHQSGSAAGAAFGFNPDATNHVAWIVNRTLDLADPFVEVYRYDGPSGTTTTNALLGVTKTASRIELLDQTAPQPESAFYTLEIELRP